jgi:hydroxymethylpyrimidine pyrophosphatase-like HAD family hydrolase
MAWMAERQQSVVWTHDRHAYDFDGFVLPGARRHPAVDRWVQRTVCILHPPPADALTAYEALRFSVIDEPAVLADLARDYVAHFGDRVSHNVIHVPAYDFTVLETFAGGVDKWTGIVRLCRHWDIDPAATAAIGDDVNDLPMIRNAGLGAAIGNARPEVQAAAQRVVASNDDCGVAELLEAILAGGGRAAAGERA